MPALPTDSARDKPTTGPGHATAAKLANDPDEPAGECPGAAAPADFGQPGPRILPGKGGGTGPCRRGHRLAVADADDCAITSQQARMERWTRG